MLVATIVLLVFVAILLIVICIINFSLYDKLDERSVNNLEIRIENLEKKTNTLILDVSTVDQRCRFLEWLMKKGNPELRGIERVEIVELDSKVVIS